MQSVTCKVQAYKLYKIACHKKDEMRFKKKIGEEEIIGRIFSSLSFNLLHYWANFEILLLSKLKNFYHLLLIISLIIFFFCKPLYHNHKGF